MPLTPFSITTDGVRAKIIVDGNDVSRLVSGLELRLAVGDVPRLVLLLSGEGTIEGEGIVAAEPADAVAAVRDMIRGMDPEELDRLALAEIAEQGATPGAAFKAALIRLLS